MASRDVGRENARGTLTRRLVAIGAGLLSVYLVILTGQRALDAYRSNLEVEATRREIVSLRARNIELQNELVGNRGDEEIERTAREELSLARPGDHPVILIWPGGTRPQAPAPAPQAAATEPNWREWLGLFIDVNPTGR
jgi:cell division protein FtsB